MSDRTKLLKGIRGSSAGGGDLTASASQHLLAQRQGGRGILTPRAGQHFGAQRWTRAGVAAVRESRLDLLSRRVRVVHHPADFQNFPVSDLVELQRRAGLGYGVEPHQDGEAHQSEARQRHLGGDGDAIDIAAPLAQPEPCASRCSASAPTRERRRRRYGRRSVQAFQRRSGCAAKTAVLRDRDRSRRRGGSSNRPKKRDHVTARAREKEAQNRLNEDRREEADMNRASRPFLPSARVFGQGRGRTRPAITKRNTTKIRTVKPIVRCHSRTA